METNALHLQSIEILNRELDDIVSARQRLAQVRPRVHDARDMGLSELVDRMEASLQTLVDALSARAAALADELPNQVRPPRTPSADSVREQEIPAPVEILEKLMRSTLVRADLMRCLGDARSASLLSQVRHAVIVLHWHARFLPCAEDSMWLH